MEYYWQGYKLHGQDSSEHEIEFIHARCNEFIIYFADGDLYYECTDELLKDMSIPDTALAKINLLIPSNKEQKQEILELTADAIEMWLCDHHERAEVILNDLIKRLEVNRDGTARLFYQIGAIGGAIIVWGAAFAFSGRISSAWEPWMLAAALGAAGGVFSVCLNLDSIKVNISQSILFLTTAGGTRAMIAVLGATVLLLAMRAKIVLQLIYSTGKFPPYTLDYGEMFFCFLAGFSETFVTNVLRDSERNAPNSSGDGRKNENGARPNDNGRGVPQGQDPNGGGGNDQKPSQRHAPSADGSGQNTIGETSATAQRTSDQQTVGQNPSGQQADGQQPGNVPETAGASTPETGATETPGTEMTEKKPGAA